MKMSMLFRSSLIALFLMLLVGSGSGHAEFARALTDLNAMDTSFTYQGRLVKDGEPVDGDCDFRFTLMDATTGHTIGPTLSLAAVPVTNGLFTVELDFGTNAFDGNGRLLAIEVRCPSGSGNYITLPRQKLTATPYALYALQTPWSGLLDVPPGLSDGDDNTTYSAGTGLTLNGSEFSLSPTYRLPQSCANGESTEWDGSAWVCGGGGAGDITAVYAGNGLTGGSTSGDATLAANFAGTGVANSVARSDHNHDNSYVNEYQANSVNSAMIEDHSIIVDDIVDGTVLAEISDDDGPGSFLDADMLDGQHAGAFAASVHNHLGETWTGTNMLEIEGAFGVAPLVLSNTDGFGLYLLEAGDAGIYMFSAVNDGIYINGVGNPSEIKPSADKNALEIAGVQGNGLYVGQADRYGIAISKGEDGGVRVVRAGNPSKISIPLPETPDGFYVAGAEGHGLYVGHTDLNGVTVHSAGNPSSTTASGSHSGFEVHGSEGNGLYVGQADNRGVEIGSVGSDGVYVISAGVHSRSNYPTSPNGFAVAGAEGAGLFVGRADQRAVEVISAGWDGVFVNEVGNPSTSVSSIDHNGFEVAGAEGFGLYVGRADLNGIEVNSTKYDGIYVKYPGRRAATFNGDVQITGNLSKGGGSFKIDHPLDPEGKYLNHAFVESPDMKNLYDGVVVLDAGGQAWVDLPEWFEALNQDFRYQLTAIGGSMPGLYIAREIEDNRFQIAGGEAGLKVSWQVTGIRHDPYAETNPIPVEEIKPEAEQGTYLHPAAYGQPETKGMIYRDSQMLAQEASDAAAD